MAPFWNKLKNKKIIINNNLNTKDTESETFPDNEIKEELNKNTFQEKITEAADAVVDTSKKIASTVADKTGDAVSYGKMKIKVYNLEHQRDKLLSELGGQAYELLKIGNEGIYENIDIKDLLSKIKKYNEQIEETKSAV